MAESDDSDVIDDNSSVVDEGDTNRTPSSDSDDSDDVASSHSTLSIYPDHRDEDYSWTAYIKEARSYHHLMQNGHRIATLDISLPAPEGDEDEAENSFARGLLFYPFPALQTLKLRCLPRRGGLIPRVVLDEHVSSVGELLLENILPIQIMDFSLNITSLNLTIIGSDTLIDTGLFLRFLEKKQNLRSLTLHNYEFFPLLEPVTPVALNNLRQLDVSSGSTTLLRYLVTPPLGPRSFLRMEEIPWCFLVRVENGTAGTSTTVSTLAPSLDSDADEFLPVYGFRGFRFWLGRSNSGGG